MHKIFELAEQHGVELCHPDDQEEDHPRPPIADLERGVGFNGVGTDQGHETFQFDGQSSDYCKTARNEYDWVVCLTLLRIATLYPNFEFR